MCAYVFVRKKDSLFQIFMHSFFTVCLVSYCCTQQKILGKSDCWSFKLSKREKEKQSNAICWLRKASLYSFVVHDTYFVLLYTVALKNHLTEAWGRCRKHSRGQSKTITTTLDFNYKHLFMTIFEMSYFSYSKLLFA